MDDLRRIDLNLLLTLHALLAEQHVSRAALRLHRSQPAVSHALAQLREIFQDPLLVRRAGRLQPTLRALELAAPLQDALQQLDALLGSPGFEPARARRSFRLAMSDYGARVVLPGLMRCLRETAPGIDLVVSLARPHVLVAMRPGADNEIDQALAALGQQRRVVLALPHWAAASDVLVGTDLVLTVARRSVQNLKAQRGLRCFEPPLAIRAFAFQQVWHERRKKEAAHHWLREQVMRACAP